MSADVLPLVYNALDSEHAIVCASTVIMFHTAQNVL